ncbi:hypothetical protein NC796_18240 [Aliifodinibius sp. S!AR15-10]|uniref:hypothetical protein n=1 Tax=Aliifodinibius sp. S!AR15-10 TaxID=2950437 RepID=UPI00285DC78B|nr:hypothetical protein [Aliifodinibius sp. S!AR15-10]MDR8393102.1 hypothetical protein [Aliifodinibius sp. S!AR15-10]
MNESALPIEPGFVVILLVAIFAFSATILAAATLLNKIRLRNVRLSWKAGKLNGYPLFATLFLLFSIGLFGLAFYKGSTAHWITFMLYSWMSGGWFVNSYLASKRYITDNAIIKNINDPSQSIQWYQIRDYLEQDEGSYQKYIFLYREDETPTKTQFVRLELDVPKKYLENFRKLLAHKLGRQINCYNTASFDLEQFNLK